METEIAERAAQRVPTQGPPSWGRRKLTRLLLDLLLIGCIALGISFRFRHVNWNEGADLHPDEYGLTGTLTQLRMPDSLAEYFNTRLSPLSPYQKYAFDGSPADPGPDNRMRWGQWPQIIIRRAAEATGRANYGELRRVGRRLSALADSLILLLLYLIGRRLYSHRVGLLAAAFSALSVLQIQQSHFMTVDNFAALFSVAALYCAIRIAVMDRPAPEMEGREPDGAQGPSAKRWRFASGWRWYVLFGVAFGMALASRVNLLPLGGMVVLAAAIANQDLWPARGGSEDRRLWGVLALLALAMICAALTFRLTQPMSFRAERGDTSFFTLHLNPDWVDSMEVAASESRGVGAGPPGEQWTGRTAILFPLTNIVLWGLGPPLGLAAWIGLIWAGWQMVKRQDGSGQHILPLVWAGGYFLFMGTRWVMSMRYFLPIYPFLCLFAAWALWEVWSRSGSSIGTARGNAANRLARLRRPAAGLLGGAALIGTLLWASGFVAAVYGRENTRLRASRWIFANVPAAVDLRIVVGDGAQIEPIPVAYDTDLSPGSPLPLRFVPNVSGQVTEVGLSVDEDAFQGAGPRSLRIILSRDPEGLDMLGEASTDIVAPAPGMEGSEVAIPFGPVQVASGSPYFLILDLTRGEPMPLAGSTLANESWDEGLPLRIDGRDPYGGLYRGLTMEVRWADDENKREMFIENLAAADYIVLPSQRAHWSISRLPLTYPMTLEYYRALFDGRLGFDLVATFEAPIRFGDLYISDVAGAVSWGAPPELPLFNRNPLGAEEAFSVYDHAPVWIFKKRLAFSIDQARAILDSVNLDRVVPQGPREASRVPASLLMLPPGIWDRMRSGGTWASLFPAENPLNRWPALAVLAWWATMGLIGLAAFPLARRALPGFGEHSYALARIFGLLVLAWSAWLLGSLGVDPSRAVILILLIGMGGFSGLLLWRERKSLALLLRRDARYVITIELLALVAFALFLAVRLGNPDLWHPYRGGEKPMDFAYLTAVLKSTSFPPYDPWFSGGYINYYYFGFVLVGLPIKLLGLEPAVAYNLALPTLFALTAVGAFAVASGLLEGGERSADRPCSRATLAGVAAAVAVVLVGNLGTVKLLVDALVDVGHGAGPQRVGAALEAIRGAWLVVSGAARLPIPLDQWYWNPSRAIPPGLGESGAPITEFPFFTFLYGDLHAHMIDLPLTLLSVGWSISFVLGMKGGRMRKRPTRWVALLAGGLIIGSLRATNTWDLPLYLLLGVLAALVGPPLAGGEFSKRALLEGVGMAGALAGSATLAFVPFAYWYAQGYTRLQLWHGSKTPLGAYLTIHGLFLFIIVGWLIAESRQWLAETPVSRLSRLRPYLRSLLGGALGAAMLLVLLAAAGYAVALIVIPLWVWVGLLFLRRGFPLQKRMTLLLFAAGLGLTLLVEVVVLGGDIGRMNTVFKFYLGAWVIFGVSSGAALAWTWGLLRRWSRRWRRAWIGVAALLILGGALYPLTATPAKIMDRIAPGAPHTLDGMAYMRYATHYELGTPIDLSQDYSAIRWMQTHVQGCPVIVEASIPEYHWGSRFAIYTGLPTVLGWNWHQRQQRIPAGEAQVWSRQGEVTQFYTSPSVDRANDFLRKYDVRYIVVGQLERIYYEWVGPCTSTGDPAIPLECDLSGRPFGMAAPNVPVQECELIDPGEVASGLRCPTHGLEKFERMVGLGLLKIAYRDGDTTIYAPVP